MERIDLYLVRVWCGLSRFRASARRVTDDESQVFASPEDLTRFIVASRDAPQVAASTPVELQPAGSDAGIRTNFEVSKS